jgi:hypothetical protein
MSYLIFPPIPRPTRLFFMTGSPRTGVFLFSHPGEFTPVCTTEIGRTAQLADAFAKRHVKPLGPSTDTVAEHLKWIKDVDEAESCFHKAGRRFGLICGPRHSEKDGVGPIWTSLNW